MAIITPFFSFYKEKGKSLDGVVLMLFVIKALKVY